MDTIRQYITDAIEELRHVRWPTRQQAVRLSVIVLVFTGAAAAVFGTMDFVLSEALQILLSLSL
jgi:preprotein translocase SecE subunit